MEGEMKMDMFPKEITPLTDCDYTAHWGLTDLYDDAEAKLRELLASGQPFNTGWCGSKKEIASFRIMTNGTAMRIEVCEDIDEGPELLDDAVWDLGYTARDFTEAEYEMMIDEVIFVENTWTACRDLELPATYNQVMDTINDAFSETRRELHEQFEFVKRTVQDVAEEKGLEKRVKE